MPTYDYICAACGHALELFQSMSESPKRKCPECRKLKLERQIGMGAAVLFKGSGFYETDYRSDSYNKAKKADMEAPSKGSSTGKKKSAESKPQGKSKKDSKK
jgi:putative FmdB family regulatory protein